MKYSRFASLTTYHYSRDIYHEAIEICDIERDLIHHVLMENISQWETHKCEKYI